MNNMVNTKLLEQRICTKNGVRYIKDNKFYIDCMAPTKIYRFIYDIKETKTVQDEIKRNEKLIKEDLDETKNLISKLRKIYDNPQEIKKVNEIRDRLTELDIHIILHKTNIEGLKNKKYIIKVSQKPSEMKVIPRKKITQKPEDIVEVDIVENAQEIEDLEIKKGGAPSKQIKDYLDNILLVEEPDFEIEKAPKLIRDFDIPFAEEDNVDFELSESYEDIAYNDMPLSTEENVEISNYY